jgi:mannose-6-phosphate isomerase-like protein (cupin superfamily)
VKAGKIWGTTELIEHNNSLEFHRIEFNEGYCCSEHYHRTKWNGFFVESGILMVKTWQEDPNNKTPQLCDETILREGEYCKVEPGKWHQFVGLETGIAFELYWSEFDRDDIVRRTQGKKHETNRVKY